MGTEYVQARNGNLYVGPSRVTFDSIVTLWKSGVTPEAIQADFPTVPLAYVYGTIAYYLEHQEEMDHWLRETEEIDRARQAAQEAANPEYYADRHRRFAEARKRLGLEVRASAPEEYRDQLTRLPL